MGISKPRAAKKAEDRRKRARVKPKTVASGKSRGAMDLHFRTTGSYLRQRLNVASGVPSISASAARRARILTEFVSSKTGKLELDKTINRRFRAAWDAQDELYSTASTRELVKGMMEGITWGEISLAQREHLIGLVDVLSELRMPTAQSGFALQGRVMQHPTAVEDAFFANPRSTASLHSRLDSARRNYISRAEQKAMSEGKSSEEVIKAGGRAAIEFTLNHFTAPMTASNVKPNSLQSTLTDDDKKLLGQVQNRERLKKLYEQLDGKLRTPETEETPSQSITRTWTGPPETIDSESEFPEAPPSPRRVTEDLDLSATDSTVSGEGDMMAIDESGEVLEEAEEVGELIEMVAFV